MRPWPTSRCAPAPQACAQALPRLFFHDSRKQHKLEKIWESDTTLATPESVLFYKDGLYVSLIDGQPWDADGKGGIGKLDKNGKIVNATWVTGLNAPKGMGLWNKKLYVADVSELVIINTISGKVESKINIAGSQGLNDITIDSKRTIYVSDSKYYFSASIPKIKRELKTEELKTIIQSSLKYYNKDIDFNSIQLTFR